MSHVSSARSFAPSNAGVCHAGLALAAASSMDDVLRQQQIRSLRYTMPDSLREALNERSRRQSAMAESIAAVLDNQRSRSELKKGLEERRRKSSEMARAIQRSVQEQHDQVWGKSR